MISSRYFYRHVLIVEISALLKLSNTRAFQTSLPLSNKLLASFLIFVQRSEPSTQFSSLCNMRSYLPWAQKHYVLRHRNEPLSGSRRVLPIRCW